MSAPWYAAQGNHDYSGWLANGTLAFGAVDPRWATRATNYTLAVPEADLTFIFIDSPRACPSYMTAPYGDCTELCAVQLAEVGCTAANALPCFLEHVAWLNSTLAATTTTWKIVVGHHPISDEHMKYAAPALAAHGVQAYLAGHVHNLQHETGADGVEYFISGAGGFTHALDAPAGVAVGASHAPRRAACAAGSACAPSVNNFFANGPGFLAVSVDGAAAAFAFVHANGTVLYNYTVHA